MNELKLQSQKPQRDFDAGVLVEIPRGLSHEYALEIPPDTQRSRHALSLAGIAERDASNRATFSELRIDNKNYLSNPVIGRRIQELEADSLVAKDSNDHRMMNRVTDDINHLVSLMYDLISAKAPG